LKYRKKDYSITPVEEVTTPILNSPVTEDNYEEGDDVVIELAYGRRQRNII